jgi:cyanophycin synthetase
MAEHLAAGGSGLQVNANGDIIWTHQQEEMEIANVKDIPMTFGGRAGHQVENALAAIGALLGVGIPVETIREGLRAFHSSAEDSKGRLNVYDVNGATVILDFAHNEAGLVHLLSFGRSMVKPGGRLIAVVGTAGDRDDHALRGIGRRAVELADMVVLKDSVHYLRGREPGEIVEEMRKGVAEANQPLIEVRNAPDERTATLQMVDQLTPADVLAVMCIEDYDYLLPEMGRRGTPQV